MDIIELEKNLLDERTNVWIDAAVKIGRSKQEEALSIIKKYFSSPGTYHVSRHAMCLLGAYLSEHSYDVEKKEYVGLKDDHLIDMVFRLPDKDDPNYLKKYEKQNLVHWIGINLSKEVLHGLSLPGGSITIQEINTIHPKWSSMQQVLLDITDRLENEIQKKEVIKSKAIESGTDRRKIDGIDSQIEKMRKLKLQTMTENVTISKLAAEYLEILKWRIFDSDLEKWSIASFLAGVSSGYLWDRFRIPVNMLTSSFYHISVYGKDAKGRGLSGDKRFAYVINLPLYLSNKPITKEIEYHSAIDLMKSVNRPDYAHKDIHWNQFYDQKNNLI